MGADHDRRTHGQRSPAPGFCHLSEKMVKWFYEGLDKLKNERYNTIMKKYLVLAVILLLAAALLALIAGQNRRGKRSGVELTFYYPVQAGGSLARDMEHIAAGFNTANKKSITVIPVYSGSYKQTAEKIMTGSAAGNGPHAALSGMLDIVDLYQAGMVKNLEPFIKAEGEAWRDDFADGLWENFMFDDGGVYGLPFQHSVCVLYYNRDMLQAAGIASPPATREALIQAIAALQAWRPNLVPLEFPADVWVLENLTLNAGETLSKNKSPDFTTPAAIAALEFLQRLVSNGALIQAWAGAAEDFAVESCAMTFNTTGSLGFVAKNAAFDWGIAALPANGSAVLSAGGGGLVMLAGQSPEQEAATWEFMRYMSSPPVSARWMQASGYGAARKSAAALESAREYFAETPQAAEAAALLAQTRPQWNTRRYQDIYAIMQTALDKALIGNNIEAQAALEQAQRDAALLLKKAETDRLNPAE
jgi:sn-glycerol 3-phosphate transport system substrate-binding protein